MGQRQRKETSTPDRGTVREDWQVKPGKSGSCRRTADVKTGPLRPTWALEGVMISLTSIRRALGRHWKVSSLEMTWSGLWFQKVILCGEQTGSRKEWKHKRRLGRDEGGPDLEKEVKTWTEVDWFEWNLRSKTGWLGDGLALGVRRGRCQGWCPGFQLVHPKIAVTWVELGNNRKGLAWVD